MQQGRDAEVLLQAHREVRALRDQQRILTDAQAVQSVRARARRAPPELIVAGPQIEQIGHHPPHGEDVQAPAVGERLPGLLDQLDTAGDDALRLDPLGGLVGRLGHPAKSVHRRRLDVVDAARDQVLPQGRALLVRRRLGVEALQERPHLCVRGRGGEHQPADLMVLQLGRQALAVLSLLRRADADLVQVDLLLHRDQVDRAEHPDQPGQRRGQLGHRLVQGRIVGRVGAAGAQEAEEQPHHLLALLAHDAGELRILAGARPIDAAAERLLRLCQLIHGAAPLFARRRCS